MLEAASQRHNGVVGMEELLFSDEENAENDSVAKLIFNGIQRVKHESTWTMKRTMMFRLN